MHVLSPLSEYVPAAQATWQGSRLVSPAGRDAKTGAETHLIRRDGVGALKPGRARRASYRLGARDLGRRARRRRLVRGRALGSSRAGVAGGRSGQRVRALRTGARNGARERAVKPCGARRARAGRGRGVGASCTRHGLRTRSCAFETRGAGLANIVLDILIFVKTYIKACCL